ncbi:hypothetical protein LTR66_000635 [Elasticomyces elasticus]|nr:hypothetical protein LTR66_000635 [Elasticomyces elasticus]
MSRTMDATTGEDSSTTPAPLPPPSPPTPPPVSTMFNESRFASRRIDVEAQGIIRAVEPLAGEIPWYEFEYPEPAAPAPPPPPPPRHYGWKLAWQAMQDGWPHLLGCGVIVGAIFWAFKESARRANMKG